MSEQIVVLAVVLGILGLFVTIIRMAIICRRRDIELLQRLGFTEVKDPDQKLVAQLAEVLKVGPKRATIGTLFRRTASRYEMYTFLPRQQEGAEVDFVIRVPGWTLPKIRIMGKVPLKGRVGNWLNGIAAKVAGLGMSPVELPGHPELVERYMIFSDNPTGAAEVIGAGWLDLLSHAPAGLAISGEGEILAFGFNDQMERAVAKRKGQPNSVPGIPGMPNPEEQRFREEVRQVERFVEGVQGR